MDKLTRYRQLLQTLLTEYGRYKPAYGDISSEVIVNAEQNHYELLRVGWLQGRRIHGATLHVDIIGEKIWVQYDGTDRPIADALVEAGVPKEDIVLGFQPEHIRPYTGFSVN